MRRLKKPELDVRLLRVLQLLLQERSVSRVADQLGQSQPAVSATLRQLRNIIGDELLVRSGKGLVLTSLAADLLGTVNATVSGFDEIAHWRDETRPENARRRVRLVAPAGLALAFVPRLTEILKSSAPGIELDIYSVPDDGSLLHRMESGEIDLVIGNWPSPPDNLRISPLFETDIICVVRPSHPLAKARSIDLATYMTQSHISPTPSSVMQWSPIDGRLSQLNLQRSVTVSVPEYSMIPYVLSRVDLVFTTARPFAEYLASFFPLSIVDAPAEFGKMKFYMLWHERAHNSGFERWLREIVRGVAIEIRTGNARVGVPANRGKPRRGK
jgi:DNA-binding transcriptional LysR family regulator